MRKLKIFIVVLGLMAIPFSACSADAAAGLFIVQMKLALKGKAHDQYFLGIMYEEGLGAKKEIEKKRRAWRRAMSKQAEYAEDAFE